MLVHISWSEEGVDPLLFSFEATSLADIKHFIFKETHLLPSEQRLFFSHLRDPIEEHPVTNSTFLAMVQEKQKYIRSNAWSPTLILKKRQSKVFFKMFIKAHARIDKLQKDGERLLNELRKKNERLNVVENRMNRVENKVIRLQKEIKKK